jgi:4-hydroxy-tetrahydrodipicolinate reductase
MGQALLRAAAAEPALAICAALVPAGSALAGTQVPGTALTYATDLAGALATAAVAVDFSSPAAAAGNLRACRAQRTPLLLGTTGFGSTLEADFAAAAGEIPLLVASNTSLGVALLAELVRQAAATLPAQFRISIQESHHAAKRDAPSGTALTLAAAARAARSAATQAAADIGIESIREGEIVGEHVVRFSGPAEELTLAHKASDRALFAQGALSAALWLSSQPPGRYSMRDVLAMKTVT